MKAACLLAAVASTFIIGANSAQARHYRYPDYVRHGASLTVSDDAVVIVQGRYLGRDPDINIRLAMIRQGFFGDQ